ncbi:MAG: hypothetical protein H7832_08330 [Magnetococcus sp. DMHC-6]
MYSKQIPTIKDAKEAGYLLILFLVLLLFLSILALSSMDTGIMEQKMAGNTQFQVKAFNNAEATLVEGETYIAANILTTFPTFKTDSGLTFDGDSFILPGNSNVTVTHVSSSVVVEITQPYLGSVPGCDAGQTGCVDYYRVTSKGGQGIGSSEQTVESIYANYIPYVE